MSNMFRRYLRRMGIWKRRKRKGYREQTVVKMPVTVEWKHLPKDRKLSLCERLKKRLRFWWER